MEKVLTHHNTRRILIEKGIPLVCIIPLFFFLTDLQIILLYIVLGLPHFILTHVYQFYAGKTRVWHVMLYVSLLALFFSLYESKYFLLLFSVTAFYFPIHFLLDEKHLFGEKTSPGFLLEILPFLLTYQSFVIYNAFGPTINPVPFVTVLAFALLTLYGILAFFRKINVSVSSIYFLGLAVVLFVVLLVNPYPSFARLFGFILLLHVGDWYVSYYFRVAHDAKKKWTYVRNVALANTAIIFLFTLFALGRGTPYGSPLGYLFLPAFYYMITIPHVIFSTRTSDFKGIVLAR